MIVITIPVIARRVIPTRQTRCSLDCFAVLAKTEERYEQP